MKKIVVLFVCVLVLFVARSFFYLTALSVWADDSGTLKTLKELDDGCQIWGRNIQFKCDYTYTEGVVSTREEAEFMSISKCKKITLKVRGQIVKSKRKTFVSHFVDLDSYTPLQTQDYIAVISETLEAQYVASNENKTLDTLYVMECSIENMSLNYPNVPQSPMNTPLNYSHSPILKVLEDLKKMVSLKPTVLKVNDDGVIQLSYGYKGQSERETDCCIKYSVLGKYPLLIERKINTGKDYCRVCMAKNFTTTNDGMVIPATIVSYYGPMKDWQGKEYEGEWLVSEWKTENVVGQRISDRDFFIPLNKDTYIGGLSLDLSKKMKQNMPEYFNIDDYSIRDLYDGLVLPENENKSNSTNLILVILGSILIVLSLFFKLYYRFGFKKNK
ncbi:MAG: hypothetical protein LBC74_02910 [Planctomycetaceae bacterium]|jgi:hypothetical protein|nr:hypothetical protein [Planctomycetaceae bacterium]